MRQKISQRNSITQATQSRAIGLIKVQLLVTIVVALLWALYDTFAVYSTVLGGLAYVIPSGLLAYYFFNKSQRMEASQIVKILYMGSLVKLVISIVLLLVLIFEFRVAVVPLFSGFVAAYIGNWFQPALEKT